jgi:hypothetical protein
LPIAGAFLAGFVAGFVADFFVAVFFWSVGMRLRSLRVDARMHRSLASGPHRDDRACARHPAGRERIDATAETRPHRTQMSSRR